MSHSPIDGSLTDGYWLQDTQWNYFRRDQIQDPKPLGVSDAKIADIAGLYAKTWNYSVGDDVEPLVARLGGEIKTTDFWETPDLHGEKGSIWILSTGEKFTIWISEKASYWASRFTIAHELGHYVLHFLRNPNRIKDKHLVAARYNQGVVDREANIFALNFLIPVSDLKKESASGRTKSDLAGRYGVPEYLLGQQAVWAGIEFEDCT